MGLTVAHSGGNGNSADRKARALRRAALIGGASALALTVAGPAFAQDGGGNGGQSQKAIADGVQNGGAGGASPNGQDGEDGGTYNDGFNDYGGGGGGGGAGTTGGAGGDGGAGGALGGAGGTPTSKDGQDGARLFSNGSRGGAGGGGGGAHGGSYVNVSVVFSAGDVSTGGDGGDGGDLLNYFNTLYGGAGGGGAGGYGVSFTANNASLTNNGATFNGGYGGEGGAGDNGASGDGGDGGIGAAFFGTGNTFINSGRVFGGNGGAGGDTAGTELDGVAGLGGAGVFGSDLTVINSGWISGGSSANAVTFGAGANVFEHRAGGRVTGNVVGDGDDLFRLGGDTDGSFDVGQFGSTYQGFGSFEKTNASVFTLTGTTTQLTPWAITAGTLAISSDAALGDSSGALTFAGTASLRTDADVTIARDIILGGAPIFNTSAGTTLTLASTLSGSAFQVEKAGSGTLVLSGDNSSINDFLVISQGTLRLATSNAWGGYVELAGGSTLDYADGVTITNRLQNFDDGVVTLNQSGGSATQAAEFFAVDMDVVKTGGGNLTLANSNYYSGTTTVAEGTLTAAHRFALGVTGTGPNPSAAGMTIVQDGATLALDDVTTAESISITGGGTAGAGALQNLRGNSRIDGAVTLAGETLIGVGQGALTIAGVVSGTNDFTKTGAGNLTLSGANTYTGTTTASEGTLTVASNGALGTADGGTIVQDGATLAFNAPVLNIADAISITGIGASGAGALRLQNGETSLNGLVTLAGDSRVVVNEGGINFRGGVTGDYDLTLNGLNNLQRVVAFSSDLDIGDGDLIADNITVAFYAGNSFTGDVRINSSTLELAAGGASTIDDNARLTMTASGQFVRLTLYQDETIGSLAGTSGLVSAGNGNRVLTLGGDNTSTSFGGEFITGGGTLSVVKTGTGTMTLTRTYGFQNNPFLGGFTIAGGTLAISADRVLGADSAALTFAGGGTTLQTLADVTSARNVVMNQPGTIDTAAGTTATFGGVISGSFRLTKAGAGTLVLAGANTLTARTTLNEGTLRIANNDAFTAYGLFAAAGTTIDYADGITNARGIQADAGLVTFNQSGGSATQSGLIADDASITKTGTGNLILSGSNTYSGTTTIAEGTLTVTNGSALGALSAGTVVEDGATLAIDGSSMNIAENISIAGAGVSGNGALRNVSGITTITGLVTLTGASTIADDDILDLAGGITGAHDLTMTGGTISSNLDIGDGTLIKNGTGILSLWGNNSFTGDVIVNSGQLVVGLSANPVNAIDDAARLTINGAGIVSIDQDVTIGTLVGSGDLEARGALRTLTIAGSDSTTFSGRLTEETRYGGVLALTKSGSGNLTLSGNNTYSGVTTVAEGTLTVGHNAALGSTDGGTIVQDGATLAFADGFTTGETITISGSGVNGAGALRALRNLATLTQQVTLAGASTIATDGAIFDLQGGIAGNFDLTLNSGTGGIAISSGLDIGDGSLTVEGSGTVALQQTNSFTGDVTVNGGTMLLGSGTSTIADTIGDTARVTVNANGMLDLAQGAEAIGSLAGSGIVRASFDGTLVVGGDNSSTTFSGALRDGTNGVLSLTKTGTGNITLSGTSNNTGTITIAEGTLTVASQNALGALAGGTIVQDGATLALTTNLGLGEAFTIAGAGVSGDGALHNVSGRTTSSGQITLADASTISADSGSTLQLWGRISGAHDLTLQGGGSISLRGGLGIGDGTLTINGASVDLESGNSFTGDVVMNSGLLEIDALGASTIDDRARLTVNGGEVVLWHNETIGSLAGTGGTIRATGTRTLTVGGDNTSTSFAGTVAGSLGLTKAGTGTFTLSGGNTYTGGTTLSAGGLNLRNANALGTGTLTASDATSLRYDTGGTAVSNAIVLNGELAITSYGGARQDGIISGTGSLRSDASITLSGANTYSGGTAIGSFGITVLNDSALGTGDVTIADFGRISYGDGIAIANALTLNGTALLGGDGAYSATQSGTISGSGTLTLFGTGALTLTGANSYSGGTEMAEGTLLVANDSALGSGTLLASGGTLGFAAADLTIANAIYMPFAFTVDTGSNSGALSGAIYGPGNLTTTGTGTLTLAGDNSYTGSTDVRSGTLLVNGDQSAATGLTSVAGGATLGGNGTIGGDVTLADGASLNPGTSPGTLTINGDLALSGGSILNFEFGEAGVAGGALNDLVNVGGDLTLDGTLNVTTSAGGSFGAGVYRLFNYGGALTDNGLTLGTLPTNDVFVQTSVANQINLINSSGVSFSFWDGATGANNGVIDGGNGTWQSGAGNRNWTGADGALNGTYDDGTFAIFQGTAGTVTIDNSLGAVTASGLQFVTDGYRVAGGTLTLTGSPQSTIRVGDGTAAGANTTATIAAAIAGDTQLVKTDLGTLVLSGPNTYTGTTTVAAGTLKVIDNANGLGSAAAGTIVADGATVDLDYVTTDESFTLSGAGVDGLGALRATRMFVNINGGISLAGDATIGSSALLFAINGGITGDADLTVVADDTGPVLIDSDLAIGANSLIKNGSGGLFLNRDNSFTGDVIVNDGELYLGVTSASTSRNLISDTARVTLSSTASLYVNQPTEVIGSLTGSGQVWSSREGRNLRVGGDNTSTTFQGTFNEYGAGTLALTKIGTGTLTLSGDSSNSGTTTVAGGTLKVTSNTALGSTAGGTIVQNGATLALSAVDIAENIVIGGTGFNGAGALRSTDGINSISGTVTLLDDASIVNETLLSLSGVDLGDNTLTVTGGVDTTFGGNGISGTGNIVIASTAVFAAGNSFTGDVTISSGNLALFAGGASAIDDNAAVVVDAGGQLAIAQNETVGSLTGTGTVRAIDAGGGATHTLTVGGNDSSFTFDGVLADDSPLALTKVGSGAFTLTGTNTYTGGTTLSGGTLVLASNAALGTGALDAADGTKLEYDAGVSIANAIDLGTGTVTFTQYGGSASTQSGAISGDGSLTKIGSGTLTLTGTNTYIGTTDVQAGILLVNGDQSAATGLTNVATGATLGGTGIIGGDVTMADGALLNPGNSPGTLTINGNLALSGGTILNFEFGQAGVAGGALNDLVNVGGDLTLDGTLNVGPSTGGTFGAGVYRVFNYGGTLTDNGLTLGSTPAGTLFVQTSVANQVNLVNSTGVSFSFWDGATGADNGTVDGGSGIWQNGIGNRNWTDANGAFNGTYDDGTFAIFQGTGGTVAVDASLGAVTASGMQFVTDGYVVEGDTLTLVGGAQAIIRVGDGTATGAGTTATIAADIAGDTQLVKTDLGTLVLSGDNTYTGGTRLDDGALVLNGSNALGTGALTTGDATSVTLADGVTIANVITLNGETAFGTGGSALGTNGAATISGVISGTGALNRTGNGTLTLTGTNTYSGGTTLRGSTTITNGNALGTGTITAAGGVLSIDADGMVLANDIDLQGGLNVDAVDKTVTLAGTISGSSTLGLAGDGTFVLTGANTYAGGTALISGTARLANDSALGTGRLILGTGATVDYADGVTIGNRIETNNRFVLNQTGGTATHSGVIAGSTSFTKTGSGTLILTGANTISRDITVAEGTLTVGSSNALGNTVGETIVQEGATLALATLVTSEDISLVGAGVEGRGALTGSGVLNGTITLTGATVIGSTAGGTLSFTQAIEGADTDLVLYGPGSTAISGGIATGTGGVTIDAGTGAVSFYAGNNFTGDLAMVSGTLEINASGASTIGDTARILAAGGSINLAQDETVGSMAGSGLTIAGIFRDQALTTGGDDSSTTFSGTLAEALGGTLALIKVGSGTFALTGGNTYSGGTSLTGGALVLGSDSALGTGMLTATNGTAIGFIGDRTIGNAIDLAGVVTLDSGSDDATLTGAISGNGTLAKVGEGTLTLTADSTYTGTLGVQAGTLVNSGAFAGSVVNAAIFRNTGTAGVTGNTGTLTNSGTLASLTNTGSATLADTSIVTGAIENGGTLALGGEAGSLLQMAGSTTVGGNAALSGDLVLQGGSLTVGSDGQLTFASLGTAEGTTLTLGTGAELIGTGNSMSLGGITNVANGASLIDNGAIQNLATGTITFAGGATIDTDTDASGDEAFINAGIVQISGDNTQVVSIGGNGGNDASNLAGAQLRVNSGRLDIAGTLANAGAISLSGSGILNVDTLVNASGGSIANAGTISAGSGIANQSGANLSSTGTLAGLVVNEGTMTAQGALHGQLSNEGAGLFTVTGDLASNGSDIANIGTVALAVTGGDLTGVGTLVNASLGADGAGGNAGLTIADTRTLAANLIANSGEIAVAGTLAARVEQTAGLLANNGTIAGDLIANGGAVTGTGTFGGDVTILAGATIAPGTIGSAATIAVDGIFGLGGTASYDLGTADVIGGSANDLILAGSAVIDGGTFDLNNAGTGTYRLINTGSAGSIAIGEFTVANAAEGSRIYTTGNGQYLNVQVGTLSTQYWDGSDSVGDGTVDGGAGVWTNALGETNWTGATGALNNSWQGTINPPVTAVFGGTAGTVSVDASAGYLGFGGMRFDSDGYALADAADDEAPELGANGTTANVFAGIASSEGGVASIITVADASSTARIEAGIGGLTATTGLIVDGAGTLELAGNNEALTGTVAVLDGTLRASGGSAISNASALVLRDDAAFELADDEAIGSLHGGAATTVALGDNMLVAGGNGDDTAFGGVMSGTGSFVKTGEGTMTLSGANTYTGITVVLEGTLALGAADILSDETFVSVEDATLDLQGNSDTVGAFRLVDGTLAGTGTLSAAEYRLEDAQVDADLGTGTLFQVGGTSVLGGTLAADLVAIDAGTLRLGTDERLANSASVQVAEGASFDLAGATETIAALYGMGTVELGVGHLTLGGTGLDSGFGGMLTGSGTLAKAGGGMFTLLGDQQGWAGNFEVLGGTLQFFGNSGGSALISGGTLSGNSTFASALTMTSGTLSPGYEDAPIGMISAQTIDLLGGTAVFDFRSPEFGGGADMLLASGAITISGTEVAIASGDPRSSFPAVQRYAIVQGDSLTGTFANGDTFEQMETDPKLFWRLRYDLVENGVALEVRRMFDFGENLADGATPNQIAVATTLSSGQLDIGDAFADAILPLADLDRADQLRVFDSMGGENLTSATTGVFIEGQRFADLLTQRIYSNALLRADSEAPAQARALAPVRSDEASALTAPNVASVSMWMQGFGGDTQLDGDAVTRDLSHNASGFAGGIEARVGQFKAGVAGGYTDGSYDVRSLQASMQGQTVHVGGYLGYEGEAAFAGLFGAYQDSDLDSTRLVSAANTRPLTAQAQIDMTGRTFGGFAGYRAPLGGQVVLTPMVGVSNIRIERHGFEETGADPLNLQVSEETREVTYGTAQLRLSAVTPVSGGTFEPYLAGGVERYWGNLSAVSDMRFAGAAGDMGAFQIIGAPLEKTVGVVGAGFDVRPNERFEIGASAGARLGGRVTQGTVEMHARIRF